LFLIWMTLTLLSSTRQARCDRTTAFSSTVGSFYTGSFYRIITLNHSTLDHSTLGHSILDHSTGSFYWIILLDHSTRIILPGSFYTDHSILDHLRRISLGIHEALGAVRDSVTQWRVFWQWRVCTSDSFGLHLCSGGYLFFLFLDVPLVASIPSVPAYGTVAGTLRRSSLEVLSKCSQTGLFLYYLSSGRRTTTWSCRIPRMFVPGLRQ
jgi:hypothetical protein